ncbi:MAG TPA: SpoIID/LytB domain-containing protein [Candidatus Nanoarchaeia archaeon]|nr:SpoIID/LytB domain-containing protein [Candidatus Nanoarchaeia archaeon]
MEPKLVIIKQGAIAVLVVGIVLFLSIDVSANLLTFPDSIKVAITNLSWDEKTDCPKLEATHGDGLEQYIKNHTVTVDTVPLKLYTQRVLDNEWNTTWNQESLRSGAMAVKLYGWYRVDEPQKWSLIGADVVDFTCDQMYDETTQLKTNQSVDDTWSYYAEKNYSGTEKVLEALHYQGTDGIWKKEIVEYPGLQMSQWGSQYLVQSGKPWEYILNYYYNNSFLAKNMVIGDAVSAKIAKGQTWKFYVIDRKEVL